MGFSSSGAELESFSDPATNSISNPVSGDRSPAWKQEANHRLASHRARRGSRSGLQAAFPGMEESAESANHRDVSVPPKTRHVADRVAARYANAPTYSQILAAEARHAARAAEAAAVAAGEARAAAQAILIGLDADRDPAPDQGRNSWDRNYETEAHAPRPVPAPSPGELHSAGEQNQARLLGARPAILEVDDLEEEPGAPVQPLPAKLLEFPRELVAARKARPRLAEGPLREEYDRDAGQSQLRIFEVEPETISTEPPVEATPTGWSSIRLDSAPPANSAVYSARTSGYPRSTSRDISAQASRRQSHAADLELPLQTASLEDRIMAAVVDGALVAAAFLVFVFVFVACTVHPPTGRPAAIGSAIAFCAFGLIYQILFFSFGQDTPGMRYAKVALCTFEDENPTRKAMRRRIGALLLSASPLGLGILWAFFDDDRLGWHDRISRTYQRSYR